MHCSVQNIIEIERSKDLLFAAVDVVNTLLGEFFEVALQLTGEGFGEVCNAVEVGCVPVVLVSTQLLPGGRCLVSGDW